MQLFKFICALVIFDSDPARFEKRPGGVPVADADAASMSSAMIRGMTDDTENFVAYFLPTRETLQKKERKRRAAIVPDLVGFQNFSHNSKF